MAITKKAALDSASERAKQIVEEAENRIDVLLTAEYNKAGDVVHMDERVIDFGVPGVIEELRRKYPDWKLENRSPSRSERRQQPILQIVFPGRIKNPAQLSS